MNTYKAVYERKAVEVSGEGLSLYAAKLQAIEELQRGTRRKVKPHMVSIMLVERDGEAVVHRADF